MSLDQIRHFQLVSWELQVTKVGCRQLNSPALLGIMAAELSQLVKRNLSGEYFLWRNRWLAHQYLLNKIIMFKQ